MADASKSQGIYSKIASLYVVTHIHNGCEISEMIGNEELAQAVVNDFACVGIEAKARKVTK